MAGFSRLRSHALMIFGPSSHNDATPNRLVEDERDERLMRR
jgi:hypothetical protein